MNRKTPFRCRWLAWVAVGLWLAACHESGGGANDAADGGWQDALDGAQDVAYDADEIIDGWSDAGDDAMEEDASDGEDAFTDEPGDPGVDAADDAPDAGDAHAVVYTWDPLIHNECYSVYVDPPTWVGPPLGPDCGAVDPVRRWMFGTTNETADFTGGGMHDIPLSSDVWDFVFHDRADGTHQVGWVIDKVNYLEYLDRYSFAGFIDSWDVNGPPRPDLGRNVYVDLQIGLFASELVTDAAVGPAKNRVMIGAVARWGVPERNNYLEVNLYRTDNFDLCLSTGTSAVCPVDVPCDAAAGDGLYDRRFHCPGLAEGVYFYGPSIGAVGEPPLAPLVADGSMHAYHIPIASLFRAAPWQEPPATWDGVELAGVYIGVEVWGRGRIWIELSDYQCYAAP